MAISSATVINAELAGIITLFICIQLMIYIKEVTWYDMSAFHSNRMFKFDKILQTSNSQSDHYNFKPQRMVHQWLLFALIINRHFLLCLKSKLWFLVLKPFHSLQRNWSKLDFCQEITRVLHGNKTSAMW